MLRIHILLDPKGDVGERQTLATIDIINVTRIGNGRASSDYAWRIQEPSKGIDAKGWLVDSTNGNAAELLGEVLAEWASKRALPLDNHGRPAAPLGALTPNEFWARQDAAERKAGEPEASALQRMKAAARADGLSEGQIDAALAQAFEAIE